MAKVYSGLSSLSRQVVASAFAHGSMRIALLPKSESLPTSTLQKKIDGLVNALAHRDDGNAHRNLFTVTYTLYNSDDQRTLELRQVVEGGRIEVEITPTTKELESAAGFLISCLEDIESIFDINTLLETVEQKRPVIAQQPTNGHRKQISTGEVSGLKGGRVRGVIELRIYPREIRELYAAARRIGTTINTFREIQARYGDDINVQDNNYLPGGKMDDNRGIAELVGGGYVLVRITGGSRVGPNTINDVAAVINRLIEMPECEKIDVQIYPPEQNAAVTARAEEPRRKQLIKNLGERDMDKENATAIYDILVEQERRLAASPAEETRRAELTKNLGEHGISGQQAIAVYEILRKQEAELAKEDGEPINIGYLIDRLREAGGKSTYFLETKGRLPSRMCDALRTDPGSVVSAPHVLARFINIMGLGSFAETVLRTSNIELRSVNDLIGDEVDRLDKLIAKEPLDREPELGTVLLGIRSRHCLKGKDKQKIGWLEATQDRSITPEELGEADLARRLKTRTGTVMDWENDRTLISNEKLDDWCDEFGISTDNKRKINRLVNWRKANKTADRSLDQITKELLEEEGRKSIGLLCMKLHEASCLVQGPDGEEIVSIYSTIMDGRTHNPLTKKRISEIIGVPEGTIRSWFSRKDDKIPGGTRDAEGVLEKLADVFQAICPEGGKGRVLEVLRDFHTETLMWKTSRNPGTSGDDIAGAGTTRKKAAQK